MILPRVLEEMSCDVIPLNAAPEEIVGEQDDAAFKARLRETGVIVRAVKANLGLFIDSPGERCFLIDERGEVLEHSAAFGVLAQLALDARPGLLLGPASTSLAFTMIADGLSSRFVPTKTTPGAVLRAAQHTETVLASDGGGGYCWPEFLVAFDAMFTAAKTLELMARSGKTISQLQGTIPEVGYVEAVEFCPWEAKGRVMRLVMERHLKDRVDLTDGVKVFLDGGWVLVVPDADKPEYRIIASASDTVRASELVREYTDVVREAVTEVQPEPRGVVET
jgi:mannose-1-phosphate guanylyltransferase/phosphomannomutase